MVDKNTKSSIGWCRRLHMYRHDEWNRHKHQVYVWNSSVWWVVFFFFFYSFQINFKTRKQSLTILFVFLENPIIFIVLITDPPEMYRKPDNITLKVGESGTFTCKSSSKIPSYMEWYPDVNLNEVSNMLHLTEDQYNVSK